MQPLILLIIIYFSATFAYFKKTGFHTYAAAEQECGANNPIATIKSADDYQQAAQTCGGTSNICWLGYIPNTAGNAWNTSDGSFIGDNLGFNSMGTVLHFSLFPWQPNQPGPIQNIILEIAGGYKTHTTSAQAMCNSCQTDSCIDNGACIEEKDTFRCVCDDNTECLNGGTCIDPIDDNDFSCDCQDGFEGTFCEVSITEVCPTLNPTTMTSNPTTMTSNPTKTPTGSSSNDDSDDQFSAALDGNLGNINEKHNKEIVENECKIFISFSDVTEIILFVMMILIMNMCLWYYCGSFAQRKRIEYGVDDKVSRV